MGRLSIIEENKRLGGLISEADPARNPPDRKVVHFTAAVVARSL